MKWTLSFLFILFGNLLLSQVSGNANYQNRVHLPDLNINIPPPSNNNFILSIKGLNNVKADAYVAIFNVTQVGKTAEEVNRLLNLRISKVKNTVAPKEGTSVFIDMISFVPLYEFEREKKLFRKDTYNEIPTGFELNKNLHIKYDKPEFLDELITICAQSEIYDLVRVDYISTDLASQKNVLIEKAAAILEEKIQKMELSLGRNLDSLERASTDGFKVIYPLEKYHAYQAYSSSSLNRKKTGQIKAADKRTTLYYQPIVDKEFDFVINPIVIEPVIQIMYELKVKFRSVPKEKASTKYIIITPNGEMKELDIKN